MDYIRKKIQKILKESFGVHEPTNRLAVWLTTELFDNLNYFHKQRTLNFERDIITLTFSPPEDIVRETLIQQIKVHVNIKNNGQNSIVGGNFDTKQTKTRIINNLSVYDININLNFNWDFKTDMSVLTTSFFQHELHHASIYIIKQNKISKTKYLNMVKNMPIYGLDKTVEKNPALKDFINNFYLALPEEINARVQEAYNDIKQHVNLPTEELTSELYNTRAMIDAVRMINYTSQEVLLLPKEILSNFINGFNSNMKTAINLINIQAIKEGERTYTEQDKIKYPKTDTTGFFEFWRKRINKEGFKLFHKLIKMAGSAKNLDEAEIRCIPYLDSVLLEETIDFKPFDYDKIDYL
jgi:hypothetical protein